MVAFSDPEDAIVVRSRRFRARGGGGLNGQGTHSPLIEVASRDRAIEIAAAVSAAPGQTAARWGNPSSCGRS